MIQLRQLKLPAPHEPGALEQKIIKTLHIRPDDLISCEIRKHSIDARKKPMIFDIYTVDAAVRREAQVLKRAKNKKDISVREKEKPYFCIPSGTMPLSFRPVIIGTGPAGLFCGYELARMGYRPVLIERGMDVDSRIKDVENFWAGGVLLPESNVQFGEGGAGTFSDGKLNTLTHDKCGRNQEVLRLFVQHGAPERILYESKPHIGTDVLITVVKNIRSAIQEMGGTVRFHTKASDIHTVQENGYKRLLGLTLQDTKSGKEEYLETNIAVLATGHSARDTFFMLHKKRVPMEPKAFAVGVRIEHPQALIDDAQYGIGHSKALPAAAYKLTAKLTNGRGVYTFCMCPGGYVVNASSEAGRTSVNGMSYSGRKGKNANSAVIVTITPEDYKRWSVLPGSDCQGQSYDYRKDNVLSGINFQRILEENAFCIGNGYVPVQLFGDFQKNIPSTKPGSILPQIKGKYTWGNVRSIFPEELAVSIEQGIQEFGRHIPGYAAADAVVSGPESRTSSPVRILRNENMESSIRGLYPCGEGAGYAGGITSAATDGLKVAETVSKTYRPFDILSRS